MKLQESSSVSRKKLRPRDRGWRKKNVVRRKKQKKRELESKPKLKDKGKKKRPDWRRKHGLPR